MPRERAASSKCRERQDSPTAFTSFPDFSKINDECFNGVKEDTFSTPRPSSRNEAGAGGEKRWGVVENVCIKDLLWVCDQTFAKTARQICSEVVESVQKESETARAQMRRDVVDPIVALTNALDRLPSRLDGPIKRIIEAEVMPSLLSFGQTVGRLDHELKASFGQVELKSCHVEDLQRRSLKLCDQLLGRFVEHTQDQLAQLQLVQSQLLDGHRSTTDDLHQLLQANQDLHGVIEQKVDALLWKHTKEQPVLVDFGSMPTAGEDDVKLVSAMAEIVEKVDVSLLSFDEKMQAWLVDARPMVREVSDVREHVESQGVAVQCDAMQVADAEVQAAGEVAVRKKRVRPERNTQRVSRVSVAPEAKEKAAKRGGVPVFADEREMKRNVRNAWMKTRYNVHELYKETGCAQRIARHPYFENSVLAVIFLNAIWMSVDIDNNPAAVLVDAPLIFVVMENFFCGFFTGELLIRFFAFARKRDCCRDFWFVFDLILNVYMIGETWILSLILLLGDLTTTEALFDASSLRIIRMVKILRLSRMAKLLRAIPELSIVIKAIGAAGRSMLVIAVFCLMVVYVFALTLKQITLIVNTDPANAAVASDFGSVLSAMNALLLRSLFADSAALVSDLTAWHPVFWPCTMLFVLMTSVTMMYMLMGVMVNVIDIVAASEREGLAVSTVALSLRQAMKCLGISAEGPIPKSAVQELLSDGEVVEFLYGMDVDVGALLEMLDQVFEDVLEREGRPLEFGDLVEIFMNLRGSNPATVQDLKALIRSVKLMVKVEMQALRSSLTGQLHSITLQLRNESSAESE